MRADNKSVLTGRYVAPLNLYHRQTITPRIAVSFAQASIEGLENQIRLAIKDGRTISGPAAIRKELGSFADALEESIASDMARALENEVSRLEATVMGATDGVSQTMKEVGSQQVRFARDMAIRTDGYKQELVSEVRSASQQQLSAMQGLETRFLVSIWK
jgi:hypothetical protein